MNSRTKLNGKLFYVAILMVMPLISCNTTQAVFSGKPLEDDIIQLTNQKEKRFRYNEAVDHNLVVSQLSNFARKATDYKTQLRRGKVYWSIKSTGSTEGISLSYKTFEDLGARKAETTFTFEYPVQLSEVDGGTEIVIKSPQNYRRVIGVGNLFLPLDPMVEEEEIVKNAQKVYDTIKAEPIEKSISDKQVIISRYPAEAIAANFDRLAACKLMTSKRSSCFIDQAEVYIAVYPYQNGSRVEAELKSKYMLTPDGKSTRERSLKILETVKKRVEGITNS